MLRARASRGWRVIFWAYGGVALALLMLTAAPLPPALQSGSVMLAGGGALVTLWVGMRIHASPDQTMWRLFASSILFFTIGISLRPFIGAEEKLPHFLPDLVLFPGYLILIVAFWRLFKRAGSPQSGAFFDMTIVVVGTFLITFEVFFLPLIEQGLPLWCAIAAMAYPIMDLVLLTLLVFTSQRRNFSLVMLASALAFLLLKDSLHGLSFRDGMPMSVTSYQGISMLVFAVLGLAALHPSMAHIGKIRFKSMQPWSWQRLSIIVPPLTAPAWLLVLNSDRPLYVTFAHFLGAIVLIFILLARASRAVAEHIKIQRTFQRLATHDSLTGLGNRVALKDHLEERIGAGQEITVFFLDLDGFKLVNDSWGHAVGDELLQEVSQRIALSLPPDAMLARTGGDEFVVVLGAQSRDYQGVSFADKITAKLMRPFHLSAGEVVITASLGVTSFQPGKLADADSLVQEADTAMYCAKENGRAQAMVYDSSMSERVRLKVDLDLALRRALARREISAVYQPLVHLVSGRIMGFEALARWAQPQGMPLYGPDVFIPAAEENGLINDIGELMLQDALDQLALWRSSVPHDVMVSINVSGKQLRTQDFAHLVVEQLTKRHIPPSSLCLEITESTFITDDPISTTSLNQLRRAGVRLSVDDFGTGYSSLSYLSRLRVHEVKIDRSFIKGVTSRKEDVAIVRATVGMAEALGLKVVAEGIETIEQRDLVADLGIHAGQGWLFGRPLPAKGAQEKLMQQWQASAWPPKGLTPPKV
ncbi:MAG: putative bifunctional diguanylate cyclase/phosphodiesterase [Actinomycetota bacterium]